MTAAVDTNPIQQATYAAVKIGSGNLTNKLKLIADNRNGICLTDQINYNCNSTFKRNYSLDELHVPVQSTKEDKPSNM